MTNHFTTEADWLADCARRWPHLFQTAGPSLHHASVDRPIERKVIDGDQLHKRSYETFTFQRTRRFGRRAR
jgi:hypothetical protein